MAPISSTAACIRVQNGGPRLNPDTICDKRLSPRAAHISSDCFLASLREFHNLWQPTSKGLRITKVRGWYDNIKKELEARRQGVEWINMTSNGGQWWALITVMKFGLF